MKAAVSSREQTIVDRQLIIETIRDVSHSESETSSVSLGVSVNWAGQFAPSVSVSASDSMQNSELVHFISGISGADVKVVAQEIKLKGAEIFGTEKLNIEGKVTVEDVEEIKESSSSHMGFSFDPIKGQGLTSINFGIGEKHDNGVVHSGVGAEASHEQTDKGGYTISGLWNNVLVRGFKEAYNWLTEPKPVANDLTQPVAPEWVDPDKVIEEETSEGEKSENQEESEKKDSKKKDAKEKVENGGMSSNPNYKEPKTWEDYLTKHTPIGDLTPEGQKAYNAIAGKIDSLNLSDADKAKYQKAAYKLFVKMENADAVEKIEIMQSLANAANGKSKGSFGISDANAYAAVLTKLPYLAELLASSVVAVAINKYLEDHPITWKGFGPSNYDGEVLEKSDNKAKAAKKEMAGGYGSPPLDPNDFDPEDNHKNNAIQKKINDVIDHLKKEHNWSPPDEAFDKIPEHLRDKVKVSKNDKGIRWDTKSDTVRIGRADPNAEYSTRQVDYVKISKNGQSLDKNGNIIPDKLYKKPSHTPEAHISLEEWLKWKNWDKPL